MDHAKLATNGFRLGISLFVLGAVGELVGTAVFGTLSGRETTLLVDREILGILLGLLSPLIFGIVLPLVE